MSKEKLNLSEIRPYMKFFDRTKYSKVFNEHGRGKGANKFRIFIPITAVDAKPNWKLTVPLVIRECLTEQLIEVLDYRAGMAKKHDGRKIRIGRALSSNKQALAAYENDPQRRGSKLAPDGWVVISRHPLDIITMSFERGWNSCMNLRTGTESACLRHDVRYGTLVAYYVGHHDLDLRWPSARITMRAFQSSKCTILRPGTEYGSGPKGFREIVEKFCDYFNSGAPAGTYELYKELYDDYDSTTLVHIPLGTSLHGLKFAELVQYAKETKNPNVLHELAACVQASTWLREIILANEKTGLPTLEYIYGVEGDKSKIVISITEHENVSAELLDKIARDKRSTPRLLAAVAKAADTSVETLDYLMQSPHPQVRMEVAVHHRIDEDISAILSKDVHSGVRRQLASSTYTHPNTLGKLLRDPDESVRMRSLINMSTPAGLAEALLKKANAHWIASRPSSTPEVLQACFQLVNTKSRRSANLYPVLDALVLNKNTPLSILEQIAEHCNELTLMSRLLSSRPFHYDLFVKIAKTRNEDVMYYLLNALPCDAQRLEVQLKIIEHKDPKMRAVLAAHDDLQLFAADLLSNDKNVDVLRALAYRDVETDPNVQFKLLTHPNAYVRNDQAVNPCTNLILIVKALREGHTFTDTGIRTIRERVADESPELLKEVSALLSKMRDW